MKRFIWFPTAVIFVVAGACSDPKPDANRNAKNEGDPAASTSAADAVAGENSAAALDPDRLARELETDLERLDEETRNMHPGLLPAYLRRTVKARKIDARLVQLLRIEMRTDTPAEQMRYSLLINELYADLDRADPGGASKAAVDEMMMAHPYMRALYGKVVAGLREAIGETEIAVDAQDLPAER